jgi:hypothetical protein
METTAKNAGNIGSETQNQENDLNLGHLTDMLSDLNVPEMLKKCSGTATKMLGNLTTTQKVVGGALLLLGVGYLSKRSKNGFMAGKKNR